MVATPESPCTLHIVVNGKVSRVGFRRFAKQSADQLGLTGWVRNRRQGGVEIMAIGDKKVLESYLAQIQQGPRRAVVQDVSVEWRQAGEPHHRFRIRWFG